MYRSSGERSPKSRSAEDWASAVSYSTESAAVGTVPVVSSSTTTTVRSFGVLARTKMYCNSFST
ncbi:Uncharacterised protein [Mycobacteroides abscessus subsp. abscessus]|nr:Uncharacterised protein [Mycobacteroides abscessus subsp. abscessus]